MAIILPWLLDCLLAAYICLPLGGGASLLWYVCQLGEGQVHDGALEEPQRAAHQGNGNKYSK